MWLSGIRQSLILNLTNQNLNEFENKICASSQKEEEAGHVKTQGQTDSQGTRPRSEDRGEKQVMH